MSTNYLIENIDWEKYEELAKNIIFQVQKLEIDYLVPILRGGAILGLTLASNLNLPTKYIRIKRSITNEINSDFGEAQMINSFDISEIKGKNILICEDTIDTEETIKLAKKYLSEYKPNKIYIATLYNFSKNYDYISGKKMDEHKWVVFPWERKLVQNEN